METTKLEKTVLDAAEQCCKEAEYYSDFLKNPSNPIKKQAVEMGMPVESYIRMKTADSAREAFAFTMLGKIEDSGLSEAGQIFLESIDKRVIDALNKNSDEVEPGRLGTETLRPSFEHDFKTDKESLI